MLSIQKPTTAGFAWWPHWLGPRNSVTATERAQESERAELLIGLFFRLFHSAWLKVASMGFLKGAAGGIVFQHLSCGDLSWFLPHLKLCYRLLDHLAHSGAAGKISSGRAAAEKKKWNVYAFLFCVWATPMNRLFKLVHQFRHVIKTHTR